MKQYCRCIRCCFMLQYDGVLACCQRYCVVGWCKEKLILLVRRSSAAGSGDYACRSGSTSSRWAKWGSKQCSSVVVWALDFVTCFHSINHNHFSLVSSSLQIFFPSKSGIMLVCTIAIEPAYFTIVGFYNCSFTIAGTIVSTIVGTIVNSLLLTYNCRYNCKYNCRYNCRYYCKFTIVFLQL